MFYFKIFKAWNPPLFFTQNLMQKCNKKKKKDCAANGTIDKMNRQPVECEKIFTNHRCNKGLTAKLYKELIQLSSQKKITQRKMGKGHE